MESRILKGESNICAIFHVFLIYRVITSSLLSLGRRSLKAVAELSLIFPRNAKLKEKITAVCSQQVVCVYSGETHVIVVIQNIAFIFWHRVDLSIIRKVIILFSHLLLSPQKFCLKSRFALDYFRNIDISLCI